MRRLEIKTVQALEIIDLDMKKALETIYADLEPVMHASSRAMGAISSMSDNTKQDKAIERRIGQDLVAQNEDIVELIRMAFPRVSEYIDDHPEAITKLMPRLNTLISDPEARKRLNLGSFSGSDLKRIWEG